MLPFLKLICDIHVIHIMFSMLPDNVNTCELLESLNFNFEICIYLASSVILSWPILSGPIKTSKCHMFSFA